MVLCYSSPHGLRKLALPVFACDLMESYSTYAFTSASLLSIVSVRFMHLLECGLFILTAVSSPIIRVYDTLQIYSLLTDIWVLSSFRLS